MTNLDDNQIASITRKAEQAKASLVAAKNGAVALATDEATNSQTWGQFAVVVAEAEGKAMAWVRLEQMVAYKTEKGLVGVTEDDVISIAFDILSGGADDSWSGRGNDVKRARFDGMRAACSDMKWL